MLLRKDFKSECWERLRAHAEKRIDALHLQLESMQNTDATTAIARGRVAELRDLLRLETAPADIPRAGDRMVVPHVAERPGESPDD